jgi:hypothetical protein
MAVRRGERKPKTTEEMIDGLRRQLTAVEKRAYLEDIDTEPLLVMGELIRIAAECEAAACRVAGSIRRDRGYTWETIGAELGIGKTGAHNRFARQVAGAPALVRTEREEDDG